jgi:ABC-type lipoprotein export system ATPase subunit
MLYGEKGTAKSTLVELIKMLVDPSAIQTLAFSRNIEGIVQKLATYRKLTNLYLIFFAGR